MLAVAGGAALVSRSSEAQAGQARRATGKPNIVFLLVDDMRLADLSRMPATQRLVGAAGTTFTQAYISFPLCCPSRATIYTGQYSHNNGVRGNAPPQGGFQSLTDRGNVLAAWLQEAGYYTTHIGKYLNGYGARAPAEPQPGWSEWRGSIDQSTYRMWGYTLLEDGKQVTYGAPLVEDPALYQTDVYRDKAEDFIRRRAASGQPFYLDVSFVAPHSENNGSRPGGQTIRSAPRHRGQLANAPLPKPTAYDEADVADKPGWLRKAPRLTTAQVTQITNAYRSRQEALLAVDEAVARLVAVLDETGQLANTYVVFMSDNGFFHGEHRIPTGKTLAYEPSTHVPLLIRGPGIPAGGRSAELVGNVDVAATFADIADAAPRRQLDGRSFLPYAQTTTRRSTRPLLLETTAAAAGGDLDQDGAANQAPTPAGGRIRAPSYRAIRAGRYKYVEYADGAKELYDLGRDPQELSNRAGDKRYKAAQNVLTTRLRSLSVCRGSACSTPVGNIPDRSK